MGQQPFFSQRILQSQGVKQLPSQPLMSDFIISGGGYILGFRADPVEHLEEVSGPGNFGRWWRNSGCTVFFPVEVPLKRGFCEWVRSTKNYWLAEFCPSTILREPQHTPGAYPRHPQSPKWKEFLHKLLVGGLGYVPGVCWKILRTIFPYMVCRISIYIYIYIYIYVYIYIISIFNDNYWNLWYADIYIHVSYLCFYNLSDIIISIFVTSLFFLGDRIQTHG